MTEKTEPSYRWWLVMFVVVCIFALVITVGGRANGHIPERTRVAACADMLAAINASTGTMFAMAFAEKSEAEMQAYMDSLLAGVATKHGLKPEQIKGICETPQK